MAIKKQSPLEELKAHLRYLNISYRELASELDVSVSTFSDKINNKNRREFLSGEIVKIGVFLNLNKPEMMTYFFPDYLRNVS